MMGRGRLDVEGQPPMAPGELLAGKFLIERVLGWGGMGVVMAAMHTQLGERVAIKFLVNQSADAADRFDRELRVVARLHGEHVVRVLDAGRTDRGVPFLVMEYLRGQTLSDVLRERGALDPAEAADFVLQVCEGLAEPHAAGIVHRDVKPSNLFLVSRTDGSPLIKLIDFGIAKVGELGDDGELTRTNSVLGSPSYASPEQLTSPKSVDARSDVWGCGVTLFRMVTGELPFGGETLAHLCMNVVSESTPSVRARRRDVPAAMEAVVERCLAKEPESRFASIAELAEALEPCGSAASKGAARRVAGILARGSKASPDEDARDQRDQREARAPLKPSASEEATATEAPPLETTGAETHGARSAPSTPEAPVRRRAWRFAAPLFGATGAVALVVMLMAHRDRPVAAADLEGPPPALAAPPPASAPVVATSAPVATSEGAPLSHPSATAAASTPPVAKKPVTPRPRPRPEPRNTGPGAALVCPGDPRCAR